MITSRNLILSIITISILSCAQPPSFQQNTPSNNSDNTQQTSQNNTVCPQKDKWGGVTCASNSNRDENFLRYLSSATNIPKYGDEINCKPNNGAGILFKMQIILNAPINLNNSNQNLTLKNTGSYLTLFIRDNNHNHQSSPLQAEYKAISGEVTGRTASVTFSLNSGSQITVDGNFDENTFSGTMSFQNSTDWKGGKGASGTLGTFIIATCNVFNMY